MAELYDDYVYAQVADAAAAAEAVQNFQLTISGTVAGQIAIYDGTAFLAGGVEGDSNGISVGLVTSPTLKLVVSLSQDLKSTASPTFAYLTITNKAAAGELQVGGGAVVKAIRSGSFTLDPGSISANSRGSADKTISGLAVGDVVILTPPDGLHSGLAYAGCRVTAADTLRIYLANITGSAIDDGSLTWGYLLVEL